MKTGEIKILLAVSRSFEEETFGYSHNTRDKIMIRIAFSGALAQDT